jgi:malonyl-CoA/methylmalonyl-CoA synthetase
MSNWLFDALTTAPDHKLWLETADGRSFTHGQFRSLTARLAHALKALGVQPGDRVAVQTDKSPEALALYLATVRAGAVYLPLNTAYTAAELEYFLGDAEPALFVSAPERAVEAQGLTDRCAVPAMVTLGTDGKSGTLLDKAAGQPDSFDTVERGADDLAAILYTSGTTGRSKGAMLSHRNLLSNSVMLRDYWRFTADDVLIHALPIYHTHGLFVASNIMLLAGGSVIFMPKFDAKAVLAAMPRATAIMGVPTFYTRLVQEPDFSRTTTANMRLLISGSAPLLAETHREVQALTGHAVLERYGMTETNMNTSNPYDGERIAGTVGLALPGVDLRIVDAATALPLPDGQIGVIEVRGENVFQGYWRQPEKTAAEFRADGFFITGDLGVRDERGYVSIVGRGKDLIISGGFNVYPKEVEEEIDALPGVVESAVIGLSHPDFGEAVAAVVVLEPGASLSESDVTDALKDRLAAFKRPKRVMFVTELPRNAMGKVQKALLRSEYAETFQNRH